MERHLGFCNSRFDVSRVLFFWLSNPRKEIHCCDALERSSTPISRSTLVTKRYATGDPWMTTFVVADLA